MKRIARIVRVDRIYDWREFYTWDARDLSDNLSIPLSTINEANYERDV